MASNAPIHRVEELWAIREKVSGLLAWIDDLGNARVGPGFDVFANEAEAEVALEDNHDPEWFEVVRIVVGGGQSP